MSFILDALRKSENERQRNQQPGIAMSQVPQARKGTRIWLPLVALLVGVNLSLLLVMWLMSDEPAAPANNALPPSPTTSPTASAPPATTPAYQERPAPSSAVTSPSAVAAPDEPPDSTAAFTPNAGKPVGVDENIPSMEELLLANLISVPPLHLDIHVYSEVTDERFVFINMNRYNEGQTLSEGPMLQAITPSGVVLRHQGYDFLVTRQ
jgi:general secretion pathway protein B